jgi:hypothetical protein
MRCLAGLLITAMSLAAAPAGKLAFTKSFPGSIPAYESVELEATGDFTYQEAASDPQPLRAKLNAADAAALFALAEKLGYFKTPLESGLKVANTGKKTFRYVDASGAVSEQVFNYSTDPSAQQLLDRFEQIGATERAYIDLDRTMHFDKLGVNDSLATIESLWLRKQLAAPAQFVPLLARIANHESYMHLVRERAAKLKDEFTAQPAGPQQSAKSEQSPK